MPPAGVVTVREYGSSPRRRPRSVSRRSGTRSPRAASRSRRREGGS